MISLKESLNAQIEFFNTTDIRLNKHNRQITLLWAELLETNYPWIKTEYLLSDANFSSQIKNLIDDVATFKIDLEEFARSTFNLSTEKLSIKLQPIDSNFKKVNILNTANESLYFSGYIDGQA